MDFKQLKIELIQKIIECDDINLLRKIEQLLDENPSEVNEEVVGYSAQLNKNVVPESYYEVLEEEFEKYKRGELTASAWKEVEKRLQVKFDGLSISAEQEEELTQRYEQHLRNGGKSYSWEEVQKYIREENGF